MMTDSPSFALTDSLAVITGASEGIGWHMAMTFAQAGARLALVSRSAERLQGMVEAVRRLDGEAVAYQADLRDLEDIERLATGISRRQGTATVLVNAAGYPLTKAARDVTGQEWDLVLDIGLKATFFTCQAFAGAMAEQGYGKVINLSSTYANTVARGKSVYAIAKAGVSQLTRALAVEWAPLGIRVNALAPTLTATPSREAVLEDPGRVQAIVGRIPLGRYATPEDLTGAALFLASRASDFVTGQTLYVDGGWTAAG